MDQNLYEQYEYARRRISQKKGFYFHFVIFSLICLFLFVANYFGVLQILGDLWIWAVVVWLLLFLFHFVKVYFIDSFMNKKWEKEQIEKMVFKQQKRIIQLEENLKNEKKT